MIPKVIHYCWFGRNPLPRQVKVYIATWRKHCPDYEIKEWNEDDFDIRINRYVYEAYMAKKYAFVSDYARLYALYTEGGIYLDTDVEVKQTFNSLLNHHSFIGWENRVLGTGILGSEKGQQWVKDIMDTYKNESFISWLGKFNTLPNPYRLNKVLRSYGLNMNYEYDVLKDDIAIYPIEILCAKNFDKSQYLITDKTISVHHYSNSWKSKRRSLFGYCYDRVKNIFLKVSCSMKFLSA